ncbi:MAG: tRNA (adenosine(37)-N6)-dimethylallyltransferase MiaA [Bacteroidales bacterium]|nr:tRNA (adenosine(37)-N6)-dimethylallyltransferase MiaA [Bacteroidales bacterium]
MEVEKRSSVYDMVVVTGPTASGKTGLAARLAIRIEGEIISADSRQIYRHMDIGTGKDYNDYVVDGIKVPYHLIDIRDPGYRYSLFEYYRDFTGIMADLRERNIFPVVCGGSGMYIDSVVSGYRLPEVPPDPFLRKSLEDKTMEELTSILSTYRKLHNVTDIDTRKRAVRAIEIEKYLADHGETVAGFPVTKPLVIGVLYSREARRERISARLKARLEEGMVEEVQKMLDRGIDPETLIYYGLEYKYITLFLTGKMEYDEMVSSLEIAIHQFAKRQMTWFRGMERRGVVIHWIDGELPIEDKVEFVIRLIE